LFNQTAARLPHVDPTKERIVEAIDKLEGFYPKSREPAVLSLMDKPEVLEELVDRVLNTVRMDASSGYPLLRMSPKKGPLVEGVHRLMLRSAVMARLALWTSTPLTELTSLSPIELVTRGFVDPVRFFVKMEPHTVEKLGKRERLIASVSVIDEIVARLLMNQQNTTEIAHWHEIPSRPGMGATDEMHGRFCEWIDQQYVDGDELTSSDMSGWDMSVKPWQFWADVERRVRLVNFRPDQDAGMRRALFHHLLTVHHHCLQHSLFVLSDGSMYEQLGGGVMKSGSYPTSSTNSYQRAHVAVLTGSNPKCVVAMGDDCVEDAKDPEAKRQLYKELGFKLKQFYTSVDGAGIEFCAHTFSRNGDVDRERIEKSAYSMLSQKYSHELWMQFQYEFRHCSRLESAVGAIAGSGWIPANVAAEAHDVCRQGAEGSCQGEVEAA
jgi:hypothetical protein